MTLKLHLAFTYSITFAITTLGQSPTSQIPTKQILKSMLHKGQEALCCFLEPSGRVMPLVDLEAAGDEEIRCLKKIPTMSCETSKI
jgi:hypothetical protein